LSRGSVRSSAKKDWHSQHNHLFKSNARDFKIGRAIQPTRDLSRYVKWPAYIRLQRQKAILKKRMKIPPSINQFSKTLDKSYATTLFRLLHSYRPETAAQKKARLAARAAAEEKGEAVQTSKPKVIKFGLSHVTTLVEQKEAKLVVIAHDVDPIELVVWLPALCTKMGIPYVIVKGKARLGHLVHQKNAAVVALTEVESKHSSQLDQLIAAAQNNVASARWGGGILGHKARQVIKKFEKAKALEARTRAI
jgi:large subunit ribosomal protein L7Ae